MNLIVACNQNYICPLRVMLTSLLESNTNEHHNIYFLYSDVTKKTSGHIKRFLEQRYHCTFLPIAIQKHDFTDFPISHHFSIETYYRFLVQDIIPATESRALWLDVDMIVKKSIQDFYYQDFEGKTLIVCKSINKHPEVLLNKLGCPEDSVYFNAGTILFNLELLRNTTLQDYGTFFAQNKEKITWLDQDILNAMYAKKTKLADYRIYNMQMFADMVFSDEDLLFIEEQTAILHYIGGVKPWHNSYPNPCVKYWNTYERKAYSVCEKFRKFTKIKAHTVYDRFKSLTKRCFIKVVMMVKQR